MKNLTELANKYKSDKGDRFGDAHGYTIFYQDLFAPYIAKDINFLEMGLKRGGPELGASEKSYRGDSPSIKMWQEFFGDRVNIIGFDICDFSLQENGNFSFTQGDSGSDDDMKRLSEFRSHYDIIIDDASHNSYHQQNAIKYLWNKLSAGGLYIIEDLHWQPHDFGLPRQVKTFDLFNDYFNNNSVYRRSDLLSEEMMQQIKDEASYIMLQRSCTGRQNGQVLALKKK
jgi:hypothetical protein